LVLNIKAMGFKQNTKIRKSPYKQKYEQNSGIE
jgi:hypothetical protein